ncbi:MAG: phosphoribosylamine--glycine ligase [Chloroflexi bacterium]|nr:phosphoribosylamine--glycine ligase [Chloroflexota bacterium]
MKVLIVGSGGREHTLAWKLAQSDKVNKLYAWPGNAGIGAIADRVGGSVMDIAGIADFAERETIDLTVVGPESPLIVGLADEIEKRGLKVYGPNKEAAQMEGSKVFAKRLMLDNGIPTALCEVFDEPSKANAYIESVAATTNDPIVVKADGEAAGKGVFVCKTKDDALRAVDIIMNQKAFGASGNRLVVEEFLDGPEASFMCFVDGETFVPMVPAQDYKRAYDNDEGPNTGGMGCYAPVPVVTDEVRKSVIDSVVKPILKALAKMGIHYRGVLYVGLALTGKGPKVVEFNARFGDPETQVVLPLLESDLVDIMLNSIDGRLDTADVSWYNSKALCVVMASGGYPGDYAKGKVITGISEAEAAGVMVFHAGTELKDNDVVTSGGRVLGVTAVGDTYEDCIERAYTGVGKIHFDGAHYRHDIGARLIK